MCHFRFECVLIKWQEIFENRHLFIVADTVRLAVQTAPSPWPIVFCFIANDHSCKYCCIYLSNKQMIISALRYGRINYRYLYIQQIFVLILCMSTSFICLHNSLGRVTHSSICASFYRPTKMFSICLSSFSGIIEKLFLIFFVTNRFKYILSSSLSSLKCNGF